jgi:uncharacterized repeat protein (TIGR01451 family)/fimbrial isopeptide formation D2 family protein
MNLVRRLGLHRWQAQASLLFAAIGLMVGVLVVQKPMEAVASIDPGLDSGNATVDRTTVPGQTILTYKTVGNSTFKAPAGVTSVRVMVVGGGGGGGSGGGGGGAGRMVAAPSATVTPGASQTVTVGGGGSGGTANNDGGDGGSSSIGSMAVAPGGGGGGGYNTTVKSGHNGGSGGGVGRDRTIGGATGTAGLGNQTGTVPSGGTGLGNDGGTSTCTGTTGWCGAAGGGGAGAVGGNSSGNSNKTNEMPGNGGAGSANDITGTSTTYAGGGGGSDDGSTAVGQGGSGGGGTGAANGSNVAGSAGTANTGSGGGGATNNGTGGAGGSGIVVIRFATQNFPDPGGVSGVQMWYKADGTGNTNAQWNDVSGYGRNLTQGTAGKQPALTANQINFNPAYIFDGSASEFRLNNQGIGGADGMTAFFGATATRNDGGYRYFNEFGDDTPSISMNNGKPDLYVRGTSPIQLTYPTDASGQPHVFSFVSPNANNQSRIVGVDNNEQSQNITSGTYTTNSGGQAGTSFGRTNGSSGTSWAGPIGEALYFNRVLTQQERQQVNSYLGIKWGVTLDQGTIGTDYIASDGTTKPWSADATYKSRVVGIGRDDTSTLNQKQSKGSSDVTIGRGAIATDNASNANTFTNDKSFLMWGDDNGATNATTAVTGAYVRLNRTWKAVSTNTPGQVQIRVPKTLVDAAGGNGILYTSNTTTFDGTSTRTAMTLNGSNYEATVTLGAGTSYFTFGSLAGSDLQFVSKTATTPGGTPITSYTPGEAIEYKLTVKNNGPANAGTVTVTDTLPTGVIPTSGGSTGGGWTCNVAGQTVTCTRPALDASITAPVITVEANIASNVTGAKNNTATVSVSNDPDSSNNSASLNLPAAPKADLSITKAHSGTPTAGGSYSYDFVVKNNGPSDVSSFTVTDTLDSNLSYASVTGTGVSCGVVGQIVTCTGPALANGATASFSMTVNVSGGYGGGVITNIGTVAVPAGATDPDSNNNSSTDNSNVVVQTDLSVAKTHSGNFTAGSNGVFTIIVSNAGPSTTVVGGITVTDTLDPDFAYVSAIGAGWSCSNSGDTVSCDYSGTVAAGNSAAAITLTVAVDPIAKGSVSNMAEESSTTPDPTGNSTSTDTVTIDSVADLALTKAHVGSGFVAGTQQQYTFTATNNGPSSDSPSYTITDTLPAGLTFAGTAAASAATCSAAAQVVTCTGGAIASGGPAQTTTINVNVSAGATGTINNSATIAPAAGTTDNVAGNNTGSDSVSVEPNADLSVVKTHVGNVTAGNNVTYNMVVSNAGPSNVSSFTLSDTLDQNYAYVSATGATCAPSGQTINCTGGTINSGLNATVTITATLESSATGTISNTATVAAPTGVNDPDTSNNSSTVTNTIDTSADLAITKTHTGNFTPAQNGTFTITATNNGPSDADTATITDILPTGLTYVSTTSPDAACLNSGQTVTCSVGPTFAKSETVTITLIVAVDPSFTGTSLDNTATVASATSDPDTTNNSSTDTVTFTQAQADLAATKAAQGTLTAGEEGTYRFTVTNNGPDNAGVVKITDPLPSYFSYQSFTSVSGGTWDCSATGQNVTCDLDSVLNNGDTAVVDMNVMVAQDAPDTATNTASVTFNGTDTSANNPSATDSISHSADLEIKITHEQKTYHSGDTVHYTYTIINHGPSAASDVVVTDHISDGLTLTNVSADAPDGSSILSMLDNALFPRAMAASNPFGCHLSGQTLTCNAATLAVGTYMLYATGKISSSFTGTITNSATITSATPDPNPNDTSATDTISGVLPAAGGLVNTGERIALIAGCAIVLIAATTVIYLWQRKRTVPTV